MPARTEDRFSFPEVARMHILGVPISVVNMPTVVGLTTSWAGLKEPRTVFVREVASLMLAADRSELNELHHEADLVVPDGMPLVWIGKLRRYGAALGRVAGADLVDAVCASSLAGGGSHYFYGGKPGVADEMARRLSARYPGLRIAGTYSPPIREIGPGFEIDGPVGRELAAIRDSGAIYVWIGMSSPKQEYFMAKAAPIVGRGVFFGVGAAFDFHSGAIKRAPKWMRDGGLEWLHRLYSEPRRLWRRYLVLVPRFVGRLVWSTMISRAAGPREHRA
jgi:N-acetylglucosaminyldiphosphoundecaprenol N-acetyl-beta-D-mannosaminyltransferase